MAERSPRDLIARHASSVPGSYANTLIWHAAYLSAMLTAGLPLSHHQIERKLRQ